MSFSAGNSLYWLITALVFFALCFAYKKRRAHFLFMGLGAASTALCGMLGMMSDNMALQICAFISFYLFWYMLLWKFVKMLEFQKNSGNKK